MKDDYVPYSYQNIVPWILGIFVITAVIPPLVGPLRYTEFKWLYKIGAWIGYFSVVFVNMAVIINAFYTLIEFNETKKKQLVLVFSWTYTSCILYFSFGACFCK